MIRIGIVATQAELQAALEQSRSAQQKDWKGALLPIGAVVLFVILLVLVARG